MRTKSLNLMTSFWPCLPEELLESNSACWFSPDSAKLAYLQLNDSRVQEIQLPLYYDPYR